jgi:uncharacterized membrane protein
MLNWFLYFSATAFLGWILESTYRSIRERRLVNSGFLTGPFVPIYGFGALAVAYFAWLLEQAHAGFYWIVVALTPTVIEYAASWILEKAFKLRLWDYRAEPFNLHGRVCLLFSGFWAVLTAAAVLYIEPFLLARIADIGIHGRYFLAGALSMYFVMDTVGSSRAFINFKAFVEDLKELAERGGAFLPQFEARSKRLPREIRRLLKPLKSFPRLTGELKPMLGAVPDWITARLESIVGGRHFRK